jgi:sugar (pentulose or hexulose) kinase
MGIDIGTTAVKVAVVSGEGRIVCEASREHNLLSPYPGWAEEDAEKWWDNTALALRQLSEAYPDVIKNIDIIGCSGMVPAIVMLDEAGVPLRYSIQQKRRADRCGNRRAEVRARPERAVQADRQQNEPAESAPAASVGQTE